MERITTDVAVVGAGHNGLVAAVLLLCAGADVAGAYAAAIEGSVGGEAQAGAQKVLTAAALTYVAGFAMALAQFLNVLGIARSSDD